ncbi:uncharacterized protein LOC122665471 [Telopea speciosissima]|uniref:uncharacterized protein LOC122665471 n=1 Tax=Telopea speciosissima TaxID=54955 RepID=UPI001CC5CB41|nr:uncharacterized protein LOC122665471 [Telopea speciosissima]
MLAAKEYKLAILLETKVKENNVNTTFQNLKRGWKFTHNLGILGSSLACHCTAVYAFNTLEGRLELWKDIEEIAAGMIDPWAVMGDFNIVRHQNEKLGGEAILHGAVEDFNACPKPFKFFDAWTTHGDYFEVVKKGWAFPIKPQSNPLLCFAAKLRNVKLELKRWNKEDFGDVFHSVKVAEEELSRIQADISLNPMDDSLIILEREAKGKLWSALQMEERVLKEKSRVKWLQLGDGNNSFFHKSMRSRFNRKHILEIVDQNGVVVEEPKRIKEEAVKFYCNLFGTDSIDEGTCPNSIHLSGAISEIQILELEREISREEIKGVVFAMKDSKAPGPDGFGARFYKTTWEIIKEDLIKAINWFFENFLMPYSVNATFISLIPKSGDVSSFAGYRPIALCNLLYKIISKIISNRLQKVIGEVISFNQSAFIKGRSIVDNILVCHDIVRGIEQKAANPTVVLKVDLHKAYDSLSRNFLFGVMERMGFTGKFLGWVKACVTTPMFSVLINGSPTGIIRRLEVDGQIKLLPRCKALYLSHLIFADDLMIFVKANRESVLASLGGLDEFASLSGLHLNRSKSSIIVGGLTQTSSMELLELTGFSETTLPIRSTKLWLDKWHPEGVLFNRFGSRICYDAGSYALAAHHALVKEIVRDGDWLPGPSTSFDLIDVWRALPSIDKLHGDNPDLVIWTGNPTGIFSTKSAWNATRVKANPVDWSEAVWFEGSIKSHSFVSWRCLVDALPTRDNLLHRGIPVQHSCEFCWAGIESRNHIFFACPFSIDIWRRIFGMCSLHGQAPMNIFDAAIWVRYAAGRAGSLGVVLKLAFCATIKHIWFERNFRIFRQKARSKDQIVEAIKGDVRTVVTSGSLSGDPSPANSHIASAWNLQVHWAIRMPRPCSWILPPNNLWSLHCDGSLSDGRAAFGGVIRNAIGQPVAAFANQGLELCILSMELAAIHRGISFA